ncbi:MAG TPA: helicase HerA-like domain-containing protein [Sphingobacteriaceae bacterium]|nr:helicase HerA-like domain-containing protein [Sphingobacteriaceae bacterium]
MERETVFIDKVSQSYHPKGAYIYLGSGILDGNIVAPAQVNFALKMMNRHGLIAGATGTGKTRTLQLIAEQLSAENVPVFMLDVKGDLSGLNEPGEMLPALVERAEILDRPFVPAGFPVELFSLSGKVGNPMRITIDNFGPIMLGRVLDLNDTQTGVLTALFKYANDNNIPLIDLEDVKKILNYLSQGEGAQEIKADYGRISTSTSSTILRKIVGLEQQGLASIFGETSFDINDLFNREDGKGVISLLNISDVQDQPLLFSTFLMSLLAQLFKTLPEVGNPDKPKLVFFFDEAHLLFKNASKAFLSQIDQIIRLIRSKGVGVFFCTQAATDIPESILGQLGSRIQHALRAFTPNDADALKKTVKTYPQSEFYEIDRVLTQLGTGQALITVLNDKGIPTEVVATHLIPPQAKMDPLDTKSFQQLVLNSPFHLKYHQVIHPRSANEIIDEKIVHNTLQQSQTKTPKGSTTRKSTRQTPLEAAQKAVTSTLAREIARGVSRGIINIFTGMLGGKKKK